MYILTVRKDYNFSMGLYTMKMVTVGEVLNLTIGHNQN